jgi:hypothetical protein
LRVKAAREKGSQNFWTIAGTYVGNVGPELFVKLLNEFAGQGASERLNKEVKNIRSIKRNQLSHSATQALLNVKCNYRMTHSKKSNFYNKPYLKVVKNLIDGIRVRKEAALKAAREAELKAASDREVALKAAAEEKEEEEEIEDFGGELILLHLMDEKEEEVEGEGSA